MVTMLSQKRKTKHERITVKLHLIDIRTIHILGRVKAHGFSSFQNPAWVECQSEIKSW